MITLKWTRTPDGDYEDTSERFLLRRYAEGWRIAMDRLSARYNIGPYRTLREAKTACTHRVSELDRIIRSISPDPDAADDAYKAGRHVIRMLKEANYTTDAGVLACFMILQLRLLDLEQELATNGGDPVYLAAIGRLRQSMRTSMEMYLELVHI